MDLVKGRNNIDRIDAKIVALLAQRLQIVKLLGKYKQKHSLPVHQRTREKEMYSTRASLAKKKRTDVHLVTAVFQTILKESRRVQRLLK
jgi:chorismate mutase